MTGDGAFYLRNDIGARASKVFVIDTDSLDLFYSSSKDQ
jgi:hypothetical protein